MTLYRRGRIIEARWESASDIAVDVVWDGGDRLPGIVGHLHGTHDGEPVPADRRHMIDAILASPRWRRQAIGPDYEIIRDDQRDGRLRMMEESCAQMLEMSITALEEWHREYAAGRAEDGR